MRMACPPPGTNSYLMLWHKPSVHDEASPRIGNSPLQLAARSAATLRSPMLACPFSMPLEDPGVPQHSESMPSGISTSMPALSAKVLKLSWMSCCFGSAGPKMVFTRAGKYTVTDSPAGAGWARLDSPAGSFAEYNGNASVPRTARPVRDGDGPRGEQAVRGIIRVSMQIDGAFGELVIGR